MIVRAYGEIELTCDNCDDAFDRPFDAEDFGVMIADARRAGWRIQPDDTGGYAHTCPACAEAARNRRRLL